MPVTQQRGMTICQPQFSRHGGDGEQWRQSVYALSPVKMSRSNPADKLVTSQFPISCNRRQRKLQLQGRGFGRKPRLQFPHLFDPALRALDGTVDFGDFISFPLKMHRRAPYSQHPCNFGVRFVQISADDFEPLTGQGTLPFGIWFGFHKPNIISLIFAILTVNSSIILLYAPR
jgi:hypothetical protein